MERLQEVSERIPQGYGTPEMGSNTSGLGQVFWYTVERADEALKKSITDMDLRTLQDWSVRLILRTAAGVDDVLSWGGQERQYQVIIDPMRLIEFQLSFREVMEVLEANNRQVGGQYINIGPEQYLVRGLGLVTDETDIGNIVIKVEHGTPVHLHDIATIKQAPDLRFGTVTRDGKEVVLGMALSRIGTNAKNVVDAVKEKVQIVKSALPNGIVLRPVYERTDLVEEAVNTAVRALVQGSVLVAIVLFLFLGELRSALVVISALPMAMLIAFVLLYTAFNSMKYATLIIANVPFAIIGGVVSLHLSGQYLSVPSAIGFITVFGVAMMNGIVLVSFINELRDKGLAVADAVRKGAELRLRPVLMTASTAILAIIPMLLSSGVGADTQRPLASVVVGGLISSTLLTLVLLPVIYEWLESRREKHP